MIDTLNILLTSIIQKQQLPTEEEKQKILQGISKYTYPIGILPLQAFNSKIFLIDELNHTIEYNNQLLSYLFSNFYSQEEINICALFFAFNVETKYTFNDNLFKIIKEQLDYQPIKKEIKYILDELKYKYLLYLIYSEIDNPLVTTLTNELSIIEEEHNQFNLGEKHL